MAENGGFVCQRELNRRVCVVSRGGQTSDKGVRRVEHEHKGVGELRVNAGVVDREMVASSHDVVSHDVVVVVVVWTTDRQRQRQERDKQVVFVRPHQTCDVNRSIVITELIVKAALNFRTFNPLIATLKPQRNII